MLVFEELDHIRQDYQWGATDEENIAKLHPLAMGKMNIIFDLYFQSIDQMQSRNNLRDPKILKEYKKYIQSWFEQLFVIRHEDDYLLSLVNFGQKMLSFGLPPHNTNLLINFMRHHLYTIVNDHFSIRPERDSMRSTVAKLLDLNLSVISIAYREKELRYFLSTSKTHKKVIEIAKLFQSALNMMLVIFLAILALMISFYTLFEIVHIVVENDYSVRNVVEVLGNLLVLWAISELMEEGLKHLRGGSFSVKVFVSVGLVALVREILIVALSENHHAVAYLAGTLLSLGIVYYLLHKSETQQQQQIP
jgi:uncharacterized membrane protein (DUF373 family)